MRAAILRNQELIIENIPDPVPGPGEVIVKTLACGICGTDLQMFNHGHELVEISRACGNPKPMDLAHGVVLGHEFCAEIVDYGAGADKRLKIGARVCAVPSLLRDDLAEYLGFSSIFPGGFGEYMILTADKLLEVPNGLPTHQAALTEPLAVVIHAVNKARVQAGDRVLVIGCGPIGLALIAVLKSMGVEPVVVSDPSPMRRELALAMGADITVDPQQASPYEAWYEAGHQAESRSIPRSQSPPHCSPWVVFNCAGTPGILDEVFLQVPRETRVILIGVPLQKERIRQAVGGLKELTVQFVNGYTEAEFARSLRHLAEGRINLAPVLTGTVGMTGVGSAFQELQNADAHAKVLVEPWRD